MGASSALAPDPVSLLRPRRKIEFSIRRLRHLAAGPAALCCAPLPKLVQAQRIEAGKLEGKNLSRLTDVADCNHKSILMNAHRLTLSTRYL